MMIQPDDIKATDEQFTEDDLEKFAAWMNGEQAIDTLLEHQKEDYQGMFKRRFQLRGKDWLRGIPAEERLIFCEIGRVYNGNGHLGGVERARTAKRDRKGRFICSHYSA